MYWLSRRWGSEVKEIVMGFGEGMWTAWRPQSDVKRFNLQGAHSKTRKVGQPALSSSTPNILTFSLYSSVPTWTKLWRIRRLNSISSMIKLLFKREKRACSENGTRTGAPCFATAVSIRHRAGGGPSLSRSLRTLHNSLSKDHGVGDDRMQSR